MKNKIKRHKYTEEENEFIRKHHKGLTCKELTDMFNQQFGTDLSVKVMTLHKTVRLKLTGAKNTGRFLKGNIPWDKGLKGWQKGKVGSWFKKGHLPQKTRPIGDERVNKNGFVEVKIGMPRVWKLKHHLIYEKYYNEKIGRWDKVMFLDGNKRNFDISNLKKVSNSEQSFLANTKLLGHNSENNSTAFLIAKLMTSVKKIEKTNQHPNEVENGYKTSKK